MDTQMLSRLQAVDPVILSEVVCKDQRSPQFEITQWSVGRLSDQGFANPDGLWLFNGHGYDDAGRRPWAIVLKVLHLSNADLPETSLWYWKREILVAQSGLCDQLPGPVKSPRYYRVDETADEGWLWLEYIKNEIPDPWSLDDFSFAAHQLGKFEGAIAVSGKIFDQSWLTRDQLLTWYPDANPDQDLTFSLNHKYITGTLRDRYLRVWTERQKLYEAIEALPKYFSHFDSMRRNLMVRTGSDGQAELVLLDWAQCGLVPLGAGLMELVGSSTVFMGWPSTDLKELDTAAYSSYLEGLREVGWSGEADTVRLAYLIWMSVWWGITFPNIFSKFCTPEAREFVTKMFGAAEEEIYLEWLPVFAYAIGCAEEALQIIQRQETSNS